MPMYETTVRTPQGETKDKVYAPNVQEAKKLFDENELPPHWSWEETEDGEIYYTDHDGETTWDDPRDNFDSFFKMYLKAVKAE